MWINKPINLELKKFKPVNMAFHPDNDDTPNMKKKHI